MQTGNHFAAHIGGGVLVLICVSAVSLFVLMIAVLWKFREICWSRRYNIGADAGFQSPADWSDINDAAERDVEAALRDERK